VCLGRRRSRRLRRLDTNGRVWLDLASALRHHRQLQRLGALSLRELGVVSALRLDVDWLRALGLGTLSLRPLGLPQRLLGVVSAQQVLSQSQLVATSARRVCIAQLLIRK